MKKAFFFLSTISLVAVASCSSDDSGSSDSATASGPLVKRMVYSQEDPEGFNYDITYTYNGNKLVEGNHVGGDKEKYYYTGDLITKIEYIIDGEVEGQDLFIYDATGRLIEYKDQDLVEDDEDRFLFSYNADNTITGTYFVGSTPYTKTLTIENDEISKIVFNGVGGETYKYSYDTKNSPFKNVTGYAKIAYAFAGDFELEGRSHNIALIRNETHSYNYTVNTYQYNSNDYPTRVVSDAVLFGNPSNVERLTVQYFYE
ncbi:hypothetical protein [uncultured Flavobacterium sp.]|uniref:hypothetical protein n=1 Tax=uncultured Flavobacterium sp. TaxID=165435 RepID=UPI0025D31FD4|nr:hypothetical protein [uncultured Flavobacterium sp.]